ncbi:MAG: ABC transporter permease [Lachnospiraceae bacterium]|nr:ABC transporter permease [Lachnospiraceae bacterium]
MAQIWEYIKIALMNIKSNKGRSILTMLGIIIGISSVIMVISIGNGLRGQVNSELEGLAGGQIAFYVDTTRKDTTVTFDQSDFDAITAQIAHIKGVTPSFGTWGTAEGPKGDFDISMTGGTTGLQYISSDPIVKGKYFTQNDYDSGSNVCIITEGNATALFGTSDVIGMTFDATFWGITQELRIIGVRQDNASSLITMGSGGVTTIQAEVPLTFMANKLGYYIDEIDQFYVVAEASEYCTEVAAKTLSLLESRHNVRGENQIMMQSFNDVSAQFDTILSFITVFISFVAAISLLVGGIGVMNIMLVSVTERTREIGIRKALGARTASVLLQFLAEAGIITLLGGIIGIIFGILGGYAVGAIAGLTPQVSVGTVIAASLFSCGVGIFFGIYPARKAAKLSPIEALRHE